MEVFVKYACIMRVNWPKYPHLRVNPHLCGYCGNTGIYVHICTFVPMYLCTYLLLHLCTHVYFCTPVQMCIFIPMYLCTSPPLYPFVPFFTSVPLHTCVPLYLCTSVPLITPEPLYKCLALCVCTPVPLYPCTFVSLFTSVPLYTCVPLHPCVPPCSGTPPGRYSDCSSQESGGSTISRLSSAGRWRDSRPRPVAPTTPPPQLLSHQLPAPWTWSTAVTWTCSSLAAFRHRQQPQQLWPPEAMQHDWQGTAAAAAAVIKQSAGYH